MPNKEKILNEFYQGLKLLIEFETGKSCGAMSSPFYAINKVVAHFNTALEEGNVIAPFFLHYLADKFPAYVDKSQLPDLATVPCHKSQAQVWIKDYQTFLALYEKIDLITKPRVIECRSVRQAEQNQKNIQRQLQQVEKEVIHLIESTSSLGGVLAAKLLEHVQEKTNNSQLNKVIIVAYEQSAFHPNLYAMYEYAQFLQKNKNMRTSTLVHQQKLNTELNILLESDGDLSKLVDYYQSEKNDRFLSQWLFQSAIHDGGDKIKFMVDRYIFDDQMQWHDKISNNDRLAEGIKWSNWYEARASSTELHSYWQEINDLACDYVKVIGKDKYKASFLCCALDRLNQQLHKQFQTMSQQDFVSQYWGLSQGLQNFKEIVKLTWSLNNGKLPLESSSIVINEMAMILEERREFKEAERLYRTVYSLDCNHMIHQYNLANILSLQNKNKLEQISLFFDAASQGCSDAIQSLFKLLVINGEGTLEHLEKLKNIIESLDCDVILPVPTHLFISFVSMTIYQRLTNNEIIKWIPSERDGKEYFQAELIVEDKCLTDEISDSNNFDTSSGENSESNRIEIISIPKLESEAKIEPKEPVKEERQAYQSTNSYRLFQPVENEAKRLEVIGNSKGKRINFTQ